MSRSVPYVGKHLPRNGTPRLPRCLRTVPQVTSLTLNHGPTSSMGRQTVPKVTCVCDQKRKVSVARKNHGLILPKGQLSGKLFLVKTDSPGRHVTEEKIQRGIFVKNEIIKGFGKGA